MSENYRNELALLDLKDAFKLAFQRSGKTQTTVAREMGWTMHNVQHVFGLNDHLPSARDIPKLCKVLGNEIILECMYGKARRRQPDAFEEIDCAALMIRLNGLFVSLGEALSLNCMCAFPMNWKRSRICGPRNECWRGNNEARYQPGTGRRSSAQGIGVCLQRKGQLPAGPVSPVRKT